MKKGLLFRYILFVVICLLFFLQVFFGSSRNRKGDSSFAVRPGTEITGIDLIQAEKKISLRKEGEEWIVNKTSEARKSAVRFLIKTLEEMRIKSPVSTELFTKEIVERKIEPVRVNVFEKHRLVRGFYVFRTESNIYGNIMKVKPSSGPYIVYLPGYDENIGSHFVVNELFWQPFSVFKLLPSQIMSVDFRNYSEPEESFLIKRTGNGFSLYDSTGISRDWDSTRVRRYISYFVSVSFESWAFDLNEEQKKEIVSSEPVYRITVTGSDGKIIKLTVREKWNLVKGEKVKDTDRVWAETDDGKGLFIIRYFSLDPILKKKSYFFGG